MVSLNVTLPAAPSDAHPAARRASERINDLVAIYFLSASLVLGFVFSAFPQRSLRLCDESASSGFRRAFELLLPHYLRDLHLVIRVPLLAAHPLRHAMPRVLPPLAHSFLILPPHDGQPLAIV